MFNEKGENLNQIADIIESNLILELTGDQLGRCNFVISREFEADQPIRKQDLNENEILLKVMNILIERNFVQIEIEEG